MSRKKIYKVPNTCRDQYNALCVNVSSRQSNSITRLFFKLPFWKSFLALCKANDAKATIVSVCVHWCCLHEWSWIGMWWLKVPYEINVSRSLEFVELIITSGTYKVCDSMPCTMRPAMLLFFSRHAPVRVIHKRECIMHSTIRWLTFKQSSKCFL